LGSCRKYARTKTTNRLHSCYDCNLDYQMHRPELCQNRKKRMERLK
jgi:hypothetical protein